jgi:hypothetical protein
VHRRHVARTIALGVALALSLAACGASWLEDAATAARSAAADSTSLEHSHWTPPHYEPPVIKPPPDQIVAAEKAIAEPAENLSSDDAKDLIDDACQAVEAVEAVGGDEQDAVDYLAEHSDSPYGRRIEGEDLVRELSEADDSAAQAWILGRVALCQWASSSSD